MSKLGLIIRREILFKLKNKTFIIMTLLTPLLIVGGMGLMIYLAKSDKTEQKILVLDNSLLFKNTLQGNNYISFTFSDMSIEQAQAKLPKSDYTGILYVPKLETGGILGAVRLLYKKAPGMAFEEYIKNQMEKIYYEDKLRANNIDPTVINNARQSVKLIGTKVDENGNVKQQSNLGIFGFVTGLLMFMFILLYGMMVFRSVMEEKTNRIVEVIISSVKPFELMMGKIIGVAILGIIQFASIAIISTLLTTILSGIFLKDIQLKKEKFDAQQELVKKIGTNANLSALENLQDNKEVFDVLDQLSKVNFVEAGICFVLFFIGGYLFYSSILAAIGSAVDSEADSQQFMTPVMIPLMIGYFMAAKIMMSPETTSVIWGSMIPFTSPIVMMARLPFGVPLWQIVLSLSILYTSFIGTTWLAAKIYRTGILMYGKKVTWKELGKWLFYK
ncbi:MAG: ABC transporter permease [Sediminibacterium sp.]|nr:ABC transporter permease [Sediminibacterium sp.]